MPSTFKSPFATSFKSACKRGTPFNQVVFNIARKNGKTPQAVWNSLFKAGLCYRQKFNGSWCYFPSFPCKTNASNWKTSQFNCWQAFCEWMLCSGQCTPEQLQKHCGSQAEFMSWCKKFWGKQFTSVSSKSTARKSTARKSTARKSTARKSTARKSTARKSTNKSSYKFPTRGVSKTSRRYKKAA